MRGALKVIRRAWSRILRTQEKILITYIVVGACAGSIIELRATAPVMPIGYHTVIWILALIFPGVAVAFSLTRLRVRQNEIVQIFRRDKLWPIYLGDRESEDIDDIDRDIEFQHYVQKRMGEYFGLWEFAGFSLLAGAATLVFGLQIARQFVIPEPFDPWELVGPPWAVITASAFLGSYAGSLVTVLRRYRTFDLRPTTFLQVTVMLVAGTLAGSFTTLLYPANEMGVLAFIIGYLASINVTFLSHLMRTQFARLTGAELPPQTPSDLSKMINNPEIVDGLQRISIHSIKELSNADPMRLYLNLPQEMPTIAAMIDEAILRSNFPHALSDLNKTHIHRFTDLLCRIDPQFVPGRATEWPEPEQVSILDAGQARDAELLKACKGLLHAGTYHYILGALHHHYRGAYFSSGATVPP